MTTDVHALVGAYALDALSDAEQAAFEQHLHDCDSCAAEVASLREAAARLADPTWSVPPPRLRQRVLGLVGEVRQLPPTHGSPVRHAYRRGRGRPGTGPPRWRHRWPRALAAAAAAIVLVAGAGLTGYAVQEQRAGRAEQAAARAQAEAAEARAQAARLRAVLVAEDARLAQTGVEGGGRLTVVTSGELDTGVAVLADAAPAGPDRTYQLWLIDEAGPAPAGLLAVDEEVMIEQVGAGESLGLTLEPAGGSAAPTSPVLATVPLR